MKLYVSCISLFLVAFVLVAEAFEPAVHTIAPELQPKTPSLNPEYLVFMSDVQEGQKLPLLIFLHGGGGRGEDIHRIKKKSGMSWRGIQKHNMGPCIVVTPQSRKSNEDRSGWVPEELNVFLEQLKATLPIDTDRIYLSGNSMGGSGSWMWGGSNPEHFAAVAPISGGLKRLGEEDVSAKIDALAANLATVPVYAFAGALDKIAPPDRSKRLVEAIRKAGGEQVKLLLDPDRGHNMGGMVRSSKEYYEWMFSQKRNRTQLHGGDVAKFVPMCNGKDLAGWNTTGNWVVEDENTITLKPRPGEHGWTRYNDYLTTAREYGNFVLDLEFKFNKKGNSGVFLRVGDLSNHAKSGFEVQILDTHGKKKVGPHDCGGVIKTAAPSRNMVKPAGEWNRYTITVVDHHLTVVLNGEQIIDLDLSRSAMKNRPLSGYISFQDEGKPTWYRNVRIKEL